MIEYTMTYLDCKYAAHVHPTAPSNLQRVLKIWLINSRCVA